MTAVSVSGWAGNGFAHEACVFDDDDALRARMLPFLEEAMARGEATLVVAGEQVRALVADTLVDGGGEPALLADSEEFWQGGAQTLTAYQESMRPLLEAGKPWRFIGEPTWLAGPGVRSGAGMRRSPTTPSRTTPATASACTTAGD